MSVKTLSCPDGVSAHVSKVILHTEQYVYENYATTYVSTTAMLLKYCAKLEVLTTRCFNNNNLIG